MLTALKALGIFLLAVLSLIAGCFYTGLLVYIINVVHESKEDKKND